MKSSLILSLLLISLSCFGISTEAREYKLLKEFIEKRDINSGFYLLESYPEAVFLNDLKVMLADSLYRRNPGKAKEVLKDLELSEVSDKLGTTLLRVWQSLGLDKKELALFFPELFSAEELKSFSFSNRQRLGVIKRLMSKLNYEKAAALSGEEFCYLKGKALYRLKRYTKAYEVLRRCEKSEAPYLALKALIRSGKLKEAEVFVKGRAKLIPILAKAYFFDGNLGKSRRLFLSSKNSYEKFFYLGLIDFLRGRYSKALKKFKRALGYASPKEKAQGHFWVYKSLSALGRASETHLRKAASYGGFYGTVSKVFLSEPVWRPVKPQLSFRDRAGLSYRFKKIKDLGFLYYMRKEVRLWEDRLTKGDVLMLSRIDPYTAIRVAAKRFGYGSETYRAVAYPIPFKSVVERLSEEFGIDAALIYAIMRQESMFDPVAVSVSGAVGLMQLMPLTADWQAKRLGKDVRDVFRPETNITLGVAYLRYLKRLWKGDLVRVIASYNAGEGNVKRWKEYEDDFLFIETIPYAQTRKYVKRVLANYYVYSEMLR